MSCCKSSKPVTVNSGSGLTMKKKASPKFFQISSKKQFSLNGTNSHSYIGNPNNAIAYNGCKCDVSDKKTKISVRNYSSYLKTRIVNNNLKCNPTISLNCTKNLYGDISLNKHFNNNNLNKDHDTRIQKLKDKVFTCYENDCNNNNTLNCKSNVSNNTSTVRSKFIMNKCNVAKDRSCVPGDVPDYSIYQKKKCLYNPPDAKVIAC
tara:strand:- start:85 stop:702 length:618 start_codon:yes stop_codon:yes gene_type:complete